MFFPQLYCERYGHSYVFDQAHQAKEFIFNKNDRYQSVLLITDPVPITDEMKLLQEIIEESGNSFMLDNTHAIRIPRRRYVIGLKCSCCGRYISVPDDEFNPLLN
jgi:succinyl-CoA synthetase alpha subunit